MTRINLIPVEELSNVHLLAEHREIKRIPNLIRYWKCNFNNIPSNFTLGEWHVKFFYDKICFLHKRYNLLYKECIKRWFNVVHYGKNFRDLVMSDLYNDYIPTVEAIELSRSRIKEKLEAKPLWYKWTTILNFKF